MKNSELLQFDSDLFGFKVAKITPPNLSKEALGEVLADLNNQHAELVYWCVDAKDQRSNEAAVAHNGVLVDEKVTFYQTLEERTPFVDEHVASYPIQKPTDEIIKMSYRIAHLSRFGQDKKLHQLGLDETMYRLWMQNSALRKAADDFLVYKLEDKVAGFITLCEKNGRGDIGLLAVDERYSGRGIGKALVFSALEQFARLDYVDAQVVTQLTNIPACTLYQKCGFTLEKTEHFYHFWL